MTIKAINKLLIANRGEIACRIIKTAKQMGIPCVAVYSEIDHDALHVKMADEAFYLGEAPARCSYLDANKIIQIAKSCHANAIHPGYGFLSENTDFAEACDKNNLIFIGPPVAAIEAMGSKSRAKEIMTKANIPLVPGYHGDQQDEDFLFQQAEQIGFPLLIKATAGGGGKGMRLVHSLDEFFNKLTACKREAKASFNDDRVLLEKYLVKPRHIEFQVFADKYDNQVHCFERDCSLQRRHQKVLEEAPAPNFDPKLREQMGKVATNAAKAIGYQGAGTVEFLLDANNQFYFMEMNTRLQVEHPITEKITGLDLVEWQLLVAMGNPLPRRQEEITLSGHAFEARIYAEDPSNDFLPASGPIEYMKTPETNQNVRIDSGFTQGDHISVYYDPMIAKLIVWDNNRQAALSRLSQALKSFHVAGLTTNIEFLDQLATHDSIRTADFDTHFIEDNIDELCLEKDFIEHRILFGAAVAWLDNQFKTDQCKTHNRIDSPWQTKFGWRLNEISRQQLEFKFNQQNISLDIYFDDGYYLIDYQQQEFKVSALIKDDLIQLDIDGHLSQLSFSLAGNSFTLFDKASSWRLDYIDHEILDDELSIQTSVKAPMPGTVIDILIGVGDTVTKGQSLMVVEAMKMEHQILAYKDMQITDILVAKGDLVDESTQLIELEEI